MAELASSSSPIAELFSSPVANDLKRGYSTELSSDPVEPSSSPLVKRVRPSLTPFDERVQKILEDNETGWAKALWDVRSILWYTEEDVDKMSEDMEVRLAYIQLMGEKIMSLPQELRDEVYKHMIKVNRGFLIENGETPGYIDGHDWINSPLLNLMKMNDEIYEQLMPLVGESKGLQITLQTVYRGKKHIRAGHLRTGDVIDRLEVMTDHVNQGRGMLRHFKWLFIDTTFFEMPKVRVDWAYLFSQLAQVWEILWYRIVERRFPEPDEDEGKDVPDFIYILEVHHTIRPKYQYLDYDILVGDFSLLLRLNLERAEPCEYLRRHLIHWLRRTFIAFDEHSKSMPTICVGKIGELDSMKRYEGVHLRNHVVKEVHRIIESVSSNEKDYVSMNEEYEQLSRADKKSSHPFRDQANYRGWDMREWDDAPMEHSCYAEKREWEDRSRTKTVRSWGYFDDAGPWDAHFVKGEDWTEYDTDAPEEDEVGDEGPAEDYTRRMVVAVDGVVGQEDDSDDEDGSGAEYDPNIDDEVDSDSAIDDVVEPYKQPDRA